MLTVLAYVRKFKLSFEILIFLFSICNFWTVNAVILYLKQKYYDPKFQNNLALFVLISDSWAVPISNINHATLCLRLGH